MKLVFVQDTENPKSKPFAVGEEWVNRHGHETRYQILGEVPEKKTVVPSVQITIKSVVEAKGELETVLDYSVAEIKSMIQDYTSKEHEQLLVLEQNGKNRKSLVKFIKSNL